MLSLVTLYLFLTSALCGAVPPAAILTSQLFNNLTSFSGQPATCVNTGKVPMWNGRIIYGDCEKVVSQLKQSTAKYANQLYAFYSPTGRFRPLPGHKELEWSLPTTYSYQTCQLQVRMICDFSLGEIPTSEIPAGETFLRPSLYASAAISTWHSIIEEAEKILHCARYGTPGWASDGPRGKPSQLALPIGIFMWAVTTFQNCPLEIIQIIATMIPYDEQYFLSRLGRSFAGALRNRRLRHRDRVVRACLNPDTRGPRPFVSAEFFTAALIDIEESIHQALETGLRVPFLRWVGDGNLYPALYPHGTTTHTFTPFVTTRMHRNHQRLLLELYPINGGTGTLAEYYLQMMHGYASRRWFEVRRDGSAPWGESDAWDFNMRRASRLACWCITSVRRWRWEMAVIVAAEDQAVERFRREFERARVASLASSR
ncbi:delta 8-(E)-sphingolipid desaturase [Physcia stellaris]|nr:delta 8-(E)-sphingolipid desaturase [Physcia stellaris]